jgi:hypothetical protein
MDGELGTWLEERLRLGDVPRIVDIVRYAKENKIKVTRKAVVAALQLHPTYTFNMDQHVVKSRSNKNRPILGMSLGHLHADIGFFTKSREYETPPRYQSGYLVARDVVSRYVYIVILRGNRRAPAIISALEKILKVHREAFTHPIRSIGFDKETSVLSKAVQAFLKDNNITFAAFQHTSSKSKMAENAIKQIRTVMARLIRNSRNTERWWNLMPQVVRILNSREIYIDGKPTGFTPEKINSDNLEEFVQSVYKVSPALFFSQFSVDPRLVKFKFPVGSFVRAKLLVTSAAVIGEKRSATNLTLQSFGIVEHIPYIAKDLSLGRAYKCRDLKSGDIEIFDEKDLVLTVPENERVWDV